MHWGNPQQKQMQLEFLRRQLEFLKAPGPVVPYLPDTLDVDICNRCNLSCLTCFHSVKQFKSFPDMSMGTLKNLLSQAQGRASTITFGNHGEPFLHPQAIEMIQAVKQQGFFLNLITNGTLLTPETAQAVIDAKVDRLVFSLDSVDPQIYPQLRPGAELSNTLKNVLNFLKLNFAQGLKIYTNISTVNSLLCRKSKIDIYEYFADLPVQVVYTSDIINFQDNLAIREESKFRQQYQHITNSRELPVCLNGFDRLLIRPNGNASLCAIDWNSIHILGNINQTPYYELWNQQPARTFRQGLLDRDYSNIEKNGILCSKCDGKWVQDLSQWDKVIQGMLDESEQDTKTIMDQKINHPEKYQNLLQALSLLES